MVGSLNLILYFLLQTYYLTSNKLNFFKKLVSNSPIPSRSKEKVVKDFGKF